jgi:hypothetical protein
MFEGEKVKSRPNSYPRRLEILKEIQKYSILDKKIIPSAPNLCRSSALKGRGMNHGSNIVAQTTQKTIINDSRLSSIDSKLRG